MVNANRVDVGLQRHPSFWRFEKENQGENAVHVLKTSGVGWVFSQDGFS